MEEEYKVQIQNLANPDFQQIRSIANQRIAQLSKEKRDLLWKKLDRGVALLNTHEEMCQYLFSFGNMHEAKIKKALDYLPGKIFKQNFEIIDWGCGQGLATVCLFDYFNSKGFENKVQKVTLIEPSKKALDRAGLHVNSYLKDDTKIVSFQKKLDDVTDEDIESEANIPVIHFFSNILDIKQIDLKQLANKIDTSVVDDNYIISVGPLNATNKRIDAFYNYFNVPLIYEYENSQYEYGTHKPCSIKFNIYKLEYNKQGNLIPIEFYPSVQFHAAYKLDCVNDHLQPALDSLTYFETSTPFDIGASVYDDIHPILAVLNNMVTRGLPTKASPFIENTFQQAFEYSKNKILYGTISYPENEPIPYDDLQKWYDPIDLEKGNTSYGQVNTDLLQLLFSPIAIARVQKTILEALMTSKLDINSKEWKVLVEEKDIPCAAIAFSDLTQMFNNLTKLSSDYQNLVFPKINLNIISNKTFQNSKLHLDNNVSPKIQPKHYKTKYDLVIDISIFQTPNIEKESFSKFKAKNNCYFNIRSGKETRNERNIYTTDKIQYKDFVSTDEHGHHTEIEDTKQLLEYFLQLIFRKEGFRPGQLPILNRALQNKSVIGLLPTGGGKSLTYQLAAILQPGVTLIVDPLRSLMKDQYDGLITAGIDSCAYINSTQTKKEKHEAERKMEQSKLLFIFLSPERLAIYKFREKLKNMHELNVYFSYGVIDEVHCVSEWGHDFRFSYLHLGRNLYNYVRSKNSIISLFGLTATASFDVLADVERELSGNGAFPLDSETIVRYENSNRLELQYKIEKVRVDFQDEYEVLLNSNYATPAKIDRIKTKYKILLDNELPLPVKISDKWGFYDAKKDFLKDYVRIIPTYIDEIQSENSIKNIKESFAERQGNSIGINNELEIEITNDFYSERSDYDDAGIVFCPHKKSTGISVEKINESLVKFIPDTGTFSGGDDDDKINTSMQNLELFGRSGRDRKMALSVILLSDYKLVRINRNHTNHEFPQQLKGRWFKSDDLNQIMDHFNVKIENQYMDYLTPDNDLIRLFCKEGTNPKYFGFDNCNDNQCVMFNKCQLKKVTKEAEGWIYKEDLFEILKENNITIDKKNIEYQNADYETVMYFYNNSFKGEVIEKMSMYKILHLEKTDVFFGDDTEIRTRDITTVDGFLTTLIESNIDDEIVSFIKYIRPNRANDIEGTDTDLAKAIYRMTCIELIEDFTQDYANDRYRIVSVRKKEGDYYDGLERFLLRYYSVDRAKEEIKDVYNIEVKSSSDLEKEIFQCLNYLTTFVYDKISVKRKRAIDDMRTFCITGADETKDWKETNEELKDFIYYYFNSKYAKSDYIATNGEDYSITVDTDKGKDSKDWILFKYLKVIDENIEGGTPIDNVKHLQGAVRLLRRSLTDTNPALSLLNSFCIFYLGTNNNENLEKEVIKSYKEGMLGFAERENDLNNFWNLFKKYNHFLKPFSDSKLDKLKTEITLMIHNNEINNLATKYLQE